MPASKNKNPEVDLYLKDGCGRCDYYKTPKCKVKSWLKELKLLRTIVLESGLKEDYKWSQPCYTIENKNVLIVTAFKDYAAVAFFKGTLLKDTHKMLVSPGKSSQSAKQLRFTSVDDIKKSKDKIKDYIFQAIENEKGGKKVEFKKKLESEPQELLDAFKSDPKFKKAFYALSPGRQRGYILTFSQPKQAQTRINRINKYKSQILEGIGIHDKYRMKKK